jgi:hypothetical protein
MAEEVNIKMNVDSSGAVSNISKVEKEVEKVEKSTKNVDKSTKDVGKGTGVMKKGFQAVGNVLKAGPLVIITAIIGLIKKISDALMSNATFANEFKKVMASVNAVIAVAVDSVVDFFKNFKENTTFITEFGNRFKAMWDDPKQAIKDIGKMLMDNIINRFKAIGVMGKGIVKLFTKDWKQGLKDVANANIQMWTGVENGIDKVENKVKESKLIKNLKDAGKAAAAVEAEYQRIYRAETSLIPIEAERNKKIAQYRDIAEDTNNTLDERLEASRNAAELEKKNLDERLKIEQDRLENMKAEAEISSSKDEDLRAIAEQEAKIAQISEQSTMTMIKLKKTENRLTEEDKRTKEEIAKLNQDAANEAQDLIIENQQKRELLNTKDIENEFEKQQRILEIERDANLKRLEQEEERRLKEIELMEISEEEKNNLYLETQENFNLQKQEQEQIFNEGMIEINQNKNDKILEDDKKLQDERLKNQENFVQGATAIIGTLSSFNQLQMQQELDMAGDNEKKKEQIKKKYAEKEKKMAIIQAVIDTALSVSKNLAQYSMPLGPIMAAAAAAMGAIQIATISRQKFAKGGMIKGLGNGFSDSIPASLSNGESVINAKSTAMFKPILSQINEVGGGVRFADGGIAGESGSINTNIIDPSDIANAIKQIPVVISQGEFNRTERKVKIIESDSLL